MAESREAPVPEPDEERPPLGSWPRMYALVLGVLVVETLLFWLFTVTFE